MWGSEDDDLDERQWILAAIGGLEAVTTNAKSTASFLEMIQEDKILRMKERIFENSHKKYTLLTSQLYSSNLYSTQLAY